MPSGIAPSPAASPAPAVPWRGIRRARFAVLALLLGAMPAMAAARFSDAQIEALIARMTPEEKAGQLTLVAAVADGAWFDRDRQPGEPSAMQRQLDEIREGRIGATFNGIGADWSRRLQRAAVEQSRLKIPLAISADAIHGFRTIFPVPLAEAASWEPALAERVARASATEAAAAGVAWNLAPNVDLARDARWGRGVEGAGEDVLLARRFAAARVRGYQKNGALADRDAVAATLKHFVGYGAAEGGLDYNVVELTDRTLHEVYLPPFAAGLDAGARTVMAGFHEIGGVPAMANAPLLQGLLRDRWHFDGLVISDYTADHELTLHGVAADDRAAVKLAFLSGVDVSMTSRLYQRYLPELVRSGEVPMARLDAAVRRMLRFKRDLGLFDDPYGRMDVKREAKIEHAPATRALAREAAQRAIVMLKNDGELLPLRLPGAGDAASASAPRRIALIGPFAGAGDLNGPWTVFDDRRDAVSVEAGLREAIGARATLSVTRGADIESPIDGGVDAAVAAARAADVVVLAIGESESMSGEAQSRAEIVVPPAQQALADAVVASGTPVIVLLRTGRALALSGGVREARAILVTWFLAAETGHAIADLLFGESSPGGRLPVSFPQSPGQVPYYYARKNTGRPPPPGPRQEYTARYRELDDRPLYPFGYGLTYAPVEYGEVRLGAPILAWDGEITATARVSNRGTRAIDEVVQLYVHDKVASVTRPVRELKDFTKIALAPGESRDVTFTLTRAELEFIGPQLTRVAEPGDFEVWIAPNAAAGQPASFVLQASP